MNNPLSIVADGIHAAGAHEQALLGVLLLLFSSQLLLYGVFQKIFRNQFSAEEYYSLSIAGWTLPALLIALLWYFLGILLSPFAGTFITIVLVIVCGVFFYIRNSNIKIQSAKAATAFLLGLTLIFLVLRLTYVARAVLPLYFDSAQHYLYTKNILAHFYRADISFPWISYYHLGFHFLTAFLTFITRAQINDMMLVLGQATLAVMPFSAFFITRHWTHSNMAGCVALLLASFGWYMPAHAVDWGKYPALASVGLVPFVVSLVCLRIQNGRSLAAVQKWMLNIILLLGVVISVILHSRALIVLGILMLTWLIASLWQKLPGATRLLALGVLVIALVFEIRWTQSNSILSLVLDPYGPKGFWVTAPILFLSLFGLRKYPVPVFSCLVSIVLLMLSLFIPLGSLIPGYANVTLLDRPFVEMILYFPLTLLGGFSLAALEQTLQEHETLLDKAFPWSKVMGIAVLALLVLYAWFRYDLYPADCCDIASADDLTAIRWLDDHLPQDAQILVSSTELRVLPTEAYQGSAGGDAGTWIPPLSGRSTIYMPYNTDFSQQQTVVNLCQLGVDYIYVGKTGWGFDDSRMPLQPNAYQVLFALPNARIYEVTGCANQ